MALSKATFWERLTPDSVRLLPSFKMPPPWPGRDPWVIVRPLMVTFWPAAISNTRLALLPLTEIAIGPGTAQRHAIGDEQFAAGQRDGAAKSPGEGDGIPAVCGRDRCPQRARAAVLQVGHRQGAEQRSILERLETGDEGSSRGASSLAEVCRALRGRRVRESPSALEAMT